MDILDTDTLGKRGAILASKDSLRDKFEAILSNPYHPDTNPDGFINIGTAENYVMLEEVVEFANENRLKFDTETINYGLGPWGSPRLRNGMARYFNKWFNPISHVNPNNIIFASGLVSIFEMLGFALGDPGDGVMLTRPCYTAFPGDFGIKAALTPVFVSFPFTDQFSPVAIVHYEEALSRAKVAGIRVRFLVLCNPHNPLGRCYSPKALMALMRWCNRHSIHLIADEVYAMSVYEVPHASSSDSSSNTQPFHSVLSLNTDELIDPSLLHQTYGFSKDFASGGLRLGCLYTKNKALLRAVSAMTQFHWTPSPSETVAIAMLEDEEWTASFLTKSKEALATSSAVAKKVLDEMGIRYAEGSNAGFFLWVDLSSFLDRVYGAEDGWAKEEILNGRMFKEKIFLTPGGAQAAECPGFYRLIFTRDERSIREGLRRLGRALGLVL
ncbi:PLP-dependent transferase [Patellaria atrata CBS 101060]|uniref:PLP-dependent transferase n=1 Tax=Patellaria atrata CBS 101060 TaxID=1346257 RepID=A0A9P4SFP7_9PEZI|nr:PLP-dependent transferase [Patellaria atrata CBS 101060]